MLKRMFGTVACGVWVAAAAISPSEVVSLPGDAAYGGGDKVGSQLIAATYNAGEGPGIWIVADGGYRLYHNGALLAEDNQAGRVRFAGRKRHFGGGRERPGCSRRNGAD